MLRLHQRQAIPQRTLPLAVSFRPPSQPVTSHAKTNATPQSHRRQPPPLPPASTPAVRFAPRRRIWTVRQAPYLNPHWLTADTLTPKIRAMAVNELPS